MTRPCNLSQTLQLTATALGLGTWITAAFQDQLIESKLNLDPSFQAPLTFVGIGESTGETMPVSFRGDK